ncbi:DNA replication complex GINS protein SLD5 [Bombus vosnesenskii]|uniref:DNA replication complex GINS protein SLD5 n=3 Tax=Pyrobombus TaxID=144703 RepID=A0A6J3JUU5_9HYME|nr:DNA replication complex GINS protein SLD5 [Bombus impatiens]XP_033206299.1 DNA replication complex GINS protein SLD5 [Bombus vancouverensis nearcticus]XP_033308281.1 DNA replication complex GINS protein SLD5 [Bombus bifarius]XP_033343974.1 DNA replication complex GINS protein SLD5 [Bombus vosnesenskii]XP_050484508.1 DNA replication complex GINS protein SLD5 isoform X1 [Bombus huntii]
MEVDTGAQLIAEDSDQEEEELTAQSVLLAIEEAWLNEKFAPEILPHRSDLIECMLQQITHMEENMKRLDKGDLRLMIHRMELDRIKYMISNYLRARLEKIEKYTIHILSQEANRSSEDCYLSVAELQFAKEFLASIETLFKTVALQHMPGNFQTFEVDTLAVKPNMQAYVFLRANDRINGILLPGSMDEEIDLEPGSQHIIQYSAVADLVKTGAVKLI